MPPPNAQQISAPPDDAVRALLVAAGLSPDFTLTVLAGGANNRVFRVDGPSGRFVLKWYFAHPDDPRDRLQAEVAFTQFARQHDINEIPKSLAHSASQRIALFEFIDGHLMTDSDIDRAAIESAVRVVQELFTYSRHEDENSLPSAAEACFSFEEHARCVQSRIDWLTHISGEEAVDRDAATFVQSQLRPLGTETIAKALQSASLAGVDTTRSLPRSEQCLSPSDFGYHNAIKTPGGNVRFIDFEYAGWDDPAKLVCDFFRQVKVPVPKAFFDDVADPICRLFAEPEAVRH